MRVHTDATLQVSLFPFLAVLFCTVGVLVLLIIVTSLQRAQGTRTQAPPDPITVPTPDGEPVQLLPRYVEVSAEGVRELLPRTGPAAVPAGADNAAAREAIVGTELPAGAVRRFSRAVRDELAWRAGIGLDDLDLIGPDPVADWLLACYERRGQEAVVFLLRPDGIETWNALRPVIDRFNRTELLAGRARLWIGYDALPARGAIELLPASGVGLRTPEAPAPSAPQPDTPAISSD